MKLLVGVLLAGIAACVAPDLDPLGSEGKERQAAIEAELATLGDHPWAGVYCLRGDRWNDTLYLAPQSGFALYHGSFCGTCARWKMFGEVLSVHGDEVRIDLDDRISGDYDALLVRGGTSEAKLHGQAVWVQGPQGIWAFERRGGTASIPGRWSGVLLMLRERGGIPATLSRPDSSE